MFKLRLHASIKSNLAWRSRHKKIRDRLRSRLRVRLNQRIKNINSLLNMKSQCQGKYQHVYSVFKYFLIPFRDV